MLTGLIAVALLQGGIGIAIAQDDAIWVEQKLTPSDGTDNSYYGSDAALIGSNAVISAQGDTVFTGAAYVLAKVAGQWTETHKLVPSDGAHGDSFGYRLAMTQSLLAVTSYTASPNGNTAQGAAYVFEPSGDSWTQVKKLVANDGVAFDDLGASVCIDGTTVYVGANGAIIGKNPSQGALYVFTQDGSDWSQTQKVIADDGAPYDNFGFSVAVQNGMMFVGAPSARVDDTPGRGAVYAYTLQAGQWTQVQKIVSDENVSFAAFGAALVFDGTHLLIGASGASRAYAFTYDGSAWNQVQAFSADDTQSGDGFGNELSLSGSHVLIGADIATVDGNGSRGAAYLFEATASGWTQKHKFIASDGVTDDFYAAALALDGDTAILATPHPAMDGHTFVGAAYFYTRDVVFADGFDGEPVAR
jgi:hypothetical protein